MDCGSIVTEHGTRMNTKSNDKHENLVSLDKQKLDYLDNKLAGFEKLARDFNQKIDNKHYLPLKFTQGSCSRKLSAALSNCGIETSFIRSHTVSIYYAITDS